jgi:hypothetical protein
MVTNTIPTAAALRLRTLPTLVSPLGVPMSGDAWRPNHNSIPATVPAVVPTVVDTQAHITRTGYGAAKQAAPPREVPR